MRLLIDSVSVNSPGGIQLRDELAVSITEQRPGGCDVVLLQPKGLEGVKESVGLRVDSQEMPGGGYRGKWKWFNQILPQLLKEYDADVLYSLSGVVSKRLCKTIATVTSVNNMMPFQLDNLNLYPMISKERLRILLLRYVFTKSLQMAHAVVFHSQHALDTVTPYTKDISGKTFVALHGFPRDLRIDISAPPSHPYNNIRYILYLSAIYPYKNHLKLIQAYQKALSEEENLPHLLIAGMSADDKLLIKIIETIRVLNLDSKIKYIGALPRKDVAVWLYNADFNIFPSVCETGAMVLAEILGLGGVLSCSNVTPMSEIAGYAGELFDPHSIDSMADAILHLSRNPERREELKRLALKRSEDLSWDVCGRAVWSAVEVALNSFKQRKQ